MHRAQRSEYLKSLCTSDSEVRRKPYLEDVRRVALKALSHGGTLTRRGTVSWDVSGRCQDAKEVTLTARPTKRPLPLWAVSPKGTAYMREGAHHPRHVVVDGIRNNPLWVDLTVPCRKCPACLRRRRKLWTQRALAEFSSASRTWFGTLTFRPEEHYQMLCRASAKAKVGTPEFAALPPAEQFRLRNRECQREITLFLKRLREKTEAPLRFFLVAEAHKSGLPHFHMLLHEVSADKPVRKAALHEQWRAGYSSWKLVQPGEGLKAIRYCAKYLTKTNEARVRASIDYGNPPSGTAEKACSDQSRMPEEIPVL